MSPTAPAPEHITTALHGVGRRSESQPQQLPVLAVWSKNAPTNLARKTVQGLVWLTLQAILVKILQMGSLIPLAWLMQPDDFGLIGLVTTVAAISAVAQQIGFKEVLIHRQKADRHWAPLAFWMSAVLGVVSGLIIALAALPASIFWSAPELYDLLLILATASPFQSLSILPEALLHNRMHFRRLAAIGVLGVFAQVFLSIALAYMGFGAKSFAIPIPIVSALRLVLLWIVAQPHIRLQWRLATRRWSLLFRESGVVFATNICAVIISQGDYAVLGALVSHEELGLYFFAFSMSVAPLQLFAQSLNSVMFPALSSLSFEVPRQIRVGLEATKMLATITIPVSLLQAATAKPIISLLFGDKWLHAIPVLSILSLGMVWRSAGWPAASLLQAQGRFKTRFYLSLVWANVLLVIVALAGWWGGILYAAIGAAVFYSIVGPITIYIAFRPHGLDWSGVFRIYALPSCLSLISVGAGWAVSYWLVAPSHHLIQIVVISGVCILLYSLAIYIFEPQLTRHLLYRLWPKTGRRPL